MQPINIKCDFNIDLSELVPYQCLPELRIAVDNIIIQNTTKNDVSKELFATVLWSAII
jgi:hypothetical protein